MSLHKIAIVVKYLPPTKYKPSCIKLSLPRWENKSITFSYHMDQLTGSYTWEMAESYLRENNIEPETLLDLGGFYVLTVDFTKCKELFKLFNLEFKSLT